MKDYFIERENIGLRPINVKDKYEFIKWHNDEDMRERIGGIFPFNEASFNEIVSLGFEEYPKNIWFSICRNKKLIGIAGLHNIKYVQKNAECAIFIGKGEERQQKNGSLALKLIEEYAFGELGLHRIYAYVFSKNNVAKHFFEKNKWKYEGTMNEAFYWKFHYRDIDIYAKLR